MIVQIEFGQPEDIGANDLDGVMIRFPFTVRQVAEGALRDPVTRHSVSVLISGTRLVSWNLGPRGSALQNETLIKTLFGFARDLIESNLLANRLRPDDRINLTGRDPEENPYDPTKIPYPTGLSTKLELPRPPIGFR